MTLDSIRLFFKKWIAISNILFYLIVILAVFFKVSSNAKNLNTANGRIENVKNRIVKHNRETVFELDNYEASFTKIKTIDNPVSFNWFKWIDVHIGDSISFYVHEPISQLADSKKQIVVMGISVNGQLKESITESIINKYYEDNYPWLLLAFFINLTCFFLFVFPSFSKTRLNKIGTGAGKNVPVLLFVILIVFLLWGVPWLLARYQWDLEGSSIYRTLMIYWKFFLFLIISSTNIIFRNRLIKPTF